LKTNPPEQPFQLLTICVVIALTITTHSMIQPLVPLYSSSLGASPSLIGVLVAATYLFPLFLAIPVGALLDRMGVRGFISGGVAAVALAPMAVWLLSGLVPLAITQVFLGLAHLLVVVSAQTFVASLPGNGERNFGWYTAFLSAGQLAGPLLAGIVADTLGYLSAFLIAGLISVPAVLIAFGLRPVPGSQQIGRYKSGQSVAQLGLLLKNRSVRVAMLVSSCVVLSMIAYQAFLPVYMQEQGYSAATIGLLLSLLALVSMVVRPFISRTVQAFGGRMKTFVATMLSVSVGVGLVALSTELPWLLLAAMLVGVGTGITQPLSLVLVVEQVQASKRSLALGLRLTANRVTQVAGPLLLGRLAEASSLTLVFVATASVVLASGGIVFRARNRAEATSAGTSKS